ncbi:MAG: hypothetical protein J7L39_03495 [Candidatus Aenigmarchaeota archaeon]|nr:hypothetical protein [Candidatus Aenigmarchaeota archaeon]
MFFRMHMKCRKIIGLVLFLIIVISNGKCLALEKADYLDELIYIEFQVSAVTTDMYMYLGWLKDEKDQMREASIEAIDDLEKNRKHLMSLETPNELIELRDMNLAVINKLKEIYTGIESKKDDEIKAEFESFGELYTKYSENFKDALKKYRNMPELPKSFDPLIEELRLANNQQDKDAYQSAIQLIKEKQYSQAYDILSRLKVKYEGLPFEDCIMLRISDCILIADSDLEPENNLKPREDGLDILAQIINKNKYSPIFYEAFYKWRTMEQNYNHGMSNTSEIPNKEYNQKRWQIIQTIKKYLKDNPKDLWARKQIDLLLSLPNITRGGLMGNSNLGHWGNLYVDLSELQTKEKKK